MGSNNYYSGGSVELSVIPAAPAPAHQQLVDADTNSSCEIDADAVGGSRRVRFEEPRGAAGGSGEEVKTLLEERESGVSYMIGHTSVQAHESSPAVKKFAINVVYGFLRRNSRRPAVELGIPNTSLIEVGMTYKV